MRQAIQVFRVCAALLLFAVAARAAVPTPGAPQGRPVALVGGTIHLAKGGDIANGTIVFDRGKITAVGAGVEVPAGAERIDVTGKQVYPSLIDPNSILGLAEFDAARATIDYTETGDLTPNVKAEVA